MMAHNKVRGTIWDLVHLGGLWLLAAVLEVFLFLQAIAVGEPPRPSTAWQWALLAAMGILAAALIVVTWRVLAEWRESRD